MTATGTTKFDIFIPQSDTFQLVVTVDGGPTSLAGYTAVGAVRASKASATELASWPDSMFVVDSVNRQVVLLVPDEATAAYDWPHPAVYDIHIEGPSGDRWRLIEGLATLNYTVERS